MVTLGALDVPNRYPEPGLIMVIAVTDPVVMEVTAVATTAGWRVLVERVIIGGTPGVQPHEGAVSMRRAPVEVEIVIIGVIPPLMWFKSLAVHIGPVTMVPFNPKIAITGPLHSAATQGPPAREITVGVAA